MKKNSITKEKAGTISLLAVILALAIISFFSGNIKKIFIENEMILDESFKFYMKRFYRFFVILWNVKI